MPSFCVHHQLLEPTQTHVHRIGLPSNHLILCLPLLLPLSIFPSIRGFSHESALHIRWPKYWSVSFSISPSSEYSGLIFFRIDWWLGTRGLNLIYVQKRMRHRFHWEITLSVSSLWSFAIHSPGNI